MVLNYNMINKLIVTNIEWYDAHNPNLPTEIEIQYIEVTDWLKSDEYHGDRRDIVNGIRTLLKYKHMVEPKIFIYKWE